MKRSPALAPLSRDHHAALVVARELSRVGPEQVDAAAERFVRFLGQHEVAHFALEEQVLLPVLPAREPGPTLARRLLEDHAFLRDAMQRLRGSADAASVSFLREVGARLRAHVQMEEHELFPYLEGGLDPSMLDDIGARLAQDP